MPIYDYKCDRGCRVEMRDVLRPIADRDSASPLCPDCYLPMSRFSSVSSDRRAASDDIPGGLWLENYGPTPVKVYSHTERRRLLQHLPDGTVRRDKVTGREYRLMEQVRHVGVPGTDKSPHTVDWSKGSIDRYTLEAAAILVGRPAEQTNAFMDDRDRERIEHEFRDPSVREFSDAETLSGFAARHGLSVEDLLKG